MSAVTASTKAPMPGARGPRRSWPIRRLRSLKPRRQQLEDEVVARRAVEVAPAPLLVRVRHAQALESLGQQARAEVQVELVLGSAVEVERLEFLQVRAIARRHLDGI